MRNYCKLLLIFTGIHFYSVNTAIGKVFPSNNMELTFTQVMFEYDEVLGADNYILTIVNRNKKSPTITIKNTSLAYLVTEQLHYGEKYSWYYTAFQNKKKIYQSSKIDFSILGSNLVDGSSFKYNITKNDKAADQNNIFFLDYLGVAINRKGEPIWYLPRNTEKIKFGDSSRRSLRVTESGTFTYLDLNGCYEKNVLGQMVWKTPDTGYISGTSKENYHHDFRKLPNGNYMACGYKFINETHFYDASKKWNVRYNTLIEYDTSKKVIWSWTEKDYVDASLIMENADATITDFPGTHLNGLDYDKKQDALILSFRNTSRLLMVDHKTKEVQYELGRYPSNTTHDKNEAYTLSNQHGPAWTPDGNVLVFDNNFNPNKEMAKATNPHILIIEPPKGKELEKKVWDYECVSDSFPDGQRGKEGVAFIMYNANILVCQGSSNRIFEVTKNKELVWEVFCYEYNKPEAQWQPFSNYRSFAATSLFPTYFTIQHVYKNNKPIKNIFLLNNEGTDAKDFIVETYQPDATTLLKTETITINARTPFRYAHKSSKKVVLKIYPLHAKDLTKIVSIN
jgi:hypothetical protein